MRSIIKSISTQFTPLVIQKILPGIGTNFSHSVTSKRNFLSNPPKVCTNFINFNRRYSESPGANCWNCKKCTKRKNQFFCNECGSLQDADSSQNYFNLLSLDNNFSINSSELTTKFRQLQSLLHPDKYSNRDEREQSNSLEWSSLINKAYKTLSIPIDRGIYILKLQGISLPKDNSALDKEFLMEMMEKNEEIEDATKDNILELLEGVKTELDEAAKNLENTLNPKKYEEAKFIIVRMKYFKSLEKSIKEKAVKLGAVK